MDYTRENQEKTDTRCPYPALVLTSFPKELVCKADIVRLSIRKSHPILLHEKNT